MNDSTEDGNTRISGENVLSSSSVNLRCDELLRLAECCGKEGINMWLLLIVSLSNKPPKTIY